MGIFKREKQYEQSVDLDKLSGMVEKYLKDDKWTVQIGKTEKETIIQARKDGILRGLIAADRALTIVLSTTAKGTKVEMGVGKWIQNIAVTIVEGIITSGLFLVIDVPEMLWNAEIENKIQKKIDGFVTEESKKSWKVEEVQKIQEQKPEEKAGEQK